MSFIYFPCCWCWCFLPFDDFIQCAFHTCALFSQSHCASPQLKSPQRETWATLLTKLGRKARKVVGTPEVTCPTRAPVSQWYSAADITLTHTLTLSHYIDLFFLVFFSLSRLPNKHTLSACARVSRSLPQRAVRPPALCPRESSLFAGRGRFLIASPHTYMQSTLYLCVICYCCASVVMATPKTNRPT